MRTLYPEIAPYRTHRLAVDALHTLHVEECGNPDGIPVIFLHGGPTSACYPTFDPRIQFWTQRGFAVADLNYRGSSGYGRDYRLRLAGQWGELEVEDIRAAIDTLAAAGRIDPLRVFVRGASAGNQQNWYLTTYVEPPVPPDPWAPHRQLRAYRRTSASGSCCASAGWAGETALVATHHRAHRHAAQTHAPVDASLQRAALVGAEILTDLLLEQGDDRLDIVRLHAFGQHGLRRCRIGDPPGNTRQFLRYPRQRHHGAVCHP